MSVRTGGGHFDAVAMYNAMDAQRTARGLTWRQVVDEIWEQSAVLNARRSDHPISPSTVMNIPKRRDTTCQHALFFLRWLDRSPESFVTGGSPHLDVPLPATATDQRPRWDLKALYEALDEERRVQNLTWPQMAVQIRCSPSQLSGLKTVRYAISMRLAMRITQWLGRPAADFVYPAEW